VAETQSFVIRRSFLVPLGLLLLLSLILLAISLAQGEPRGKVIILSVIILPVTILFVESLYRRTVVGREGVTVFKLLRRRELRFSEVTSVETVQVRKRAFLTLCAGDNFLILSNAYGDFPKMVDSLLARVPSEAVTEETRRLASSPPNKSTDIITCWLAVALLTLILFIQLSGRF
jgi:hypothetical protein